MDDLAALRREIRDADEVMFRAIARRLKAARRIGELKRRQGLPLRNYDVEAEVIREARRLCKKLKLDQELGEDVMRTLIRAAVHVQEDHR